MMRSSLRRLLVLQRHVTSTCSLSTAPRLLVTPTNSLTDDKVRIKMLGLSPNQPVTLVVKVEENKIKFESRAVYRANSDGIVDLDTDESLAGSYTGCDPMGLFWSIKPPNDQGRGGRLIKKDVTAPVLYTLQAFNDDMTDSKHAESPCISEVTLERYFMAKGVKRIPVTEGPFRGTMFVPEGEGPFPGLMDTYGGVVTIIETRAALLASHGYATFALTYMFKDHLPDRLLDADPMYVVNAAEWFSQQPFVDETRFGAVGLCYGGFMSLLLATVMPKVRVVVNVNGICILPSDMVVDRKNLKRLSKTEELWPDKTRVYKTNEGVVINEVYDHPNPNIVPAWQHGAKLLFICGEDDKQVHPKWHQYYKQNFPEEYRENIEFHSYPGAGHLIEPPYAPAVRAVLPGSKRMDSIDFMPKDFVGEYLMSGGFPAPHAVAQEDSWKIILNFLNREL